jgi:hypothetical protein
MASDGSLIFYLLLERELALEIAFADMALLGVVSRTRCSFQGYSKV